MQQTWKEYEIDYQNSINGEILHWRLIGQNYIHYGDFAIG